MSEILKWQDNSLQWANDCRNYAKCVEFIKKIIKHTCCLCYPEKCISCDALDLLKEIGELE